MKLTKRVKHIYNRVDYSTSKKIFGNTAGARNNLQGAFKKSKTSEPSNPQIKELLENQFVILGQSFSEEIMEKIREKYNKCIENENSSYVTSEYDGEIYCRHVSEPEKNISELKYIITSEIASIVKEYYDGNFQIRRLDLWRNYHVPKELAKSKETFSNYWHCDARSTEFLKMFILVSNVLEDDGPFHIMSQKRTKDLIKKGFGTRENYEIPLDEMEDSNHVVKGVGNSGTVFLANTELCLHRAGIPEKGHLRDVIQVVFAPSEKPFSENWFEDFSQDEKYRLGTSYNKNE
jgi:hypothetical protein